MNKQIIGVIGGMGPQASNEFYRLLIEGARLCYGAKHSSDYPEILIDSLPIPDFLGSPDAMEFGAKVLEDRVRRMTAFGATVITMSCNTASVLSERLQKQTRVPFVSIIDSVTRKIAADNVSVLLLGSPMTLKLGVYQRQFDRFGIRYVVPGEKDIRELESIIRGVIEGRKKDSLSRRLLFLTDQFRESDSFDSVVLGCTELPLVFPHNYRLPVYSSLSILAESILKRYYTKEEL